MVYENADRAFIGEAHLKVMLDEDYIALNNNTKNPDLKTNRLGREKVEDINSFTSDIMKDVILPVLEEEINNGRNFALLRQIYYAFILAVWFKQKLRDHILHKVYIDKKKIKGVNVSDVKIRQKIYKQYIEAYKAGVYNYIKSDWDQEASRYIQRRYYSGGMDWRAPQVTVVPIEDISGDLLSEFSGTSFEAVVELSPVGSGVRPAPGGASSSAIGKEASKKDLVDIAKSLPDSWVVFVDMMKLGLRDNRDGH